MIIIRITRLFFRVSILSPYVFFHFNYFLPSIIPRSQIIIRLKFGLTEFISCCVDCDRCDKSVWFIIID